MIRFECQHEFAFPPEPVWSCLSKTDWLNRSLGLPPVKYSIALRPEGGSLITAEAKYPFGNMRWREFPFEWFEPEFYSVRRIFENGPFKESRMGMVLHPTSGGGTRVVSYAEITARGPMGKGLLKFALGPKMVRDMTQIMAQAEKYLRGSAPVIFPRLPSHAVNETALRAGLEKLAELQPGELIERLEDFLRQSPDVEMTHIRPFAVARQWGLEQWSVVGLFLHATRCGLLNLSWEILCPNCRSSRDVPADSLAQLRRTSHCDVCQIEFDAEFDKSVELKFAVNHGVRPSDDQTFCLAGPGGKPHVVCQVWLEPGENRLCRLPANSQPLRMRSMQVKEPFAWPPLDGALNGEPISITCNPARFAVQKETGAAAPGMARLMNPNPFPVLVSWQQTEWSPDILTAARATNWQEFRDLFAREIISPNEQVTAGCQVILFTDLRGSTAMYHGMGDGAAYALVRNHFTILTEAIRAQHGTVVKTIGDAVMAAFSRVDEALTAVRNGSLQLAADANPLILKCSLHLGPCLAVNANDKLDFFGTTVNVAARMVECCEGGDLIISDELYQRPETASFIQKWGYQPQSLETRHRGIEAPQRIWRIRL
jgi:class 3 adenylate cyclase